MILKGQEEITDLGFHVRTHGPPLQGRHGGRAFDETFQIVDAALAAKLPGQLVAVVGVQIDRADRLLHYLDFMIQVQTGIAFVNYRREKQNIKSG